MLISLQNWKACVFVCIEEYAQYKIYVYIGCGFM